MLTGKTHHHPEIQFTPAVAPCLRDVTTTCNRVATPTIGLPALGGLITTQQKLISTAQQTLSDMGKCVISCDSHVYTQQFHMAERFTVLEEEMRFLSATLPTLTRLKQCCVICVGSGLKTHRSPIQDA